MVPDPDRPGVQRGYDLWSGTYDDTPNPLIWLDRKHVPASLHLRGGERVLDAGCGTGAHFPLMYANGALPTGVDFSAGMLSVARRRHSTAALVRADLNRPFPFCNNIFDVVLSSLVSEHIIFLKPFCLDVRRVLRPGGKFVWSVFHPSLAFSGVEANFEHEGVEVRLGAEKHTEAEYEQAMTSSDMDIITRRVFEGTPELSRTIRRAEKYEGRPLLIIYEAVKRP